MLILEAPRESFHVKGLVVFLKKEEVGFTYSEDVLSCFSAGMIKTMVLYLNSPSNYWELLLLAFFFSLTSHLVYEACIAGHNADFFLFFLLLKSPFDLISLISVFVVVFVFLDVKCLKQ